MSWAPAHGRSTISLEAQAEQLAQTISLAGAQGCNWYWPAEQLEHGRHRSKTVSMYWPEGHGIGVATTVEDGLICAAV